MRPEIRDAVDEELAKAREKFPDWPSDPLHAIAILGEEFGELTQAALQACYTPAPESNLYHEAVQVAAMAVRWLENLEAYDFRPRGQHRDDGGTDPLNTVAHKETP